ncbi:MAG TPA: hypothetical protein VFX72_02885 [Usitatibacteraceae bacterium]|nr:hypothetical protein [Usitatibacteraceae bacterium]
MSSFEDFVLLFEEYALLVVVCAPVLAVAGLDLFLTLKGERGTGLLPTPMRFPSVGSARGVEPDSVAAGATTSLDAANDEHAEWRQVA